jgi:hypothetical protein
MGAKDKALERGGLNWPYHQALEQHFRHCLAAVTVLLYAGGCHLCRRRPQAAGTLWAVQEPHTHTIKLLAG